MLQNIVMVKAKKGKRFKITKSGLYGKGIILLGVMMLLQNNNLYSQSKDSSSKTKISIIPQVGLSIAIVSGEPPAGYTNSFIMGFNIGLKGEILVTNALAVNVGLSLCSRGRRLIATNEQLHGLLYLDIPIGLKYYIWKKNNSKFFLHAGGYFGIGLTGQVTSMSGNQTTSTDDKVFGDDRIYKKIDGGINAGIGIELKRIQLILNNQIGLANINANSNEKPARHYVFGISFGYRIGK